jgi:type II secretory pathway component GspD/PulD (secretin)
VLETVGKITSTRAFIDSAVQGKVTLELEQTSIRQVLDTLCQTARCTWSFDPDKGILAVRPKG